MALPSSKNEFTITWKIQNFSMCVVENEESLESPYIVAEVLEKTKWYLQIFPKGNNDETRLSCYLTRTETEHSSDSIKIDCSMTLVSVDNFMNKTKTKSCCTFEVNDYEEFVFGNMDEIFAKKDLLPSDVLTIQCSMWRAYENPGTSEKEATIEDSKTAGRDQKTSISDQIAINKKNLIKHVYVENADSIYSTLSEEMYLSAKKNLEDLKKCLLPNTCTIRTVIPRELRCMLWEIIKFNDIEVGERIFTSVISPLVDNPSFVLALYLSTDVDDNDYIQIDIHRNQKGNIRCLVKCIITILSALYEDQECIQDTHLFINNSDIWRIPLVKKSQLYKNKCLKKGSLLLRCEFIISQEESFHTIEETVTFPSMQRIANVRDLSDWKTGLSRIGKDGDFCDVVLQSGQPSFCAHKAILSNASPVFSDLFKSDFKEPKVDVTDCEPETLDKLLEYIYSGVLEEMPLEHTMKLFTVAKKYKVESLERRCSCVLRSVLDASNVCKVLFFADFHQDDVLKTAVIKFISVYQDEVFHSSKWENLMECNAKLAGEAMFQVLTKKFNP